MHYILSDSARTIAIQDIDLYEQLQRQNFRVFGLDMPSILEMRRQYLLRRGPLETTVGSIRATFEATSGESDPSGTRGEDEPEGTRE